MSETYDGRERRSDQSPETSLRHDIEALQRRQDEIGIAIWGQPGGESLREQFTASVTDLRTLVTEQLGKQDTRITRNETQLKFLGMAGAAALTLGGIGLTVIQMIMK